MTRPMNTTHPGRDATCETAPFHIWKSAVIEIAGVTVEAAHKYATLGRIQNAYHMGEPAWMAADAVLQFVTNGKRADRADGEVESMRRAIRTSIIR